MKSSLAAWFLMNALAVTACGNGVAPGDVSIDAGERDTADEGAAADATSDAGVAEDANGVGDAMASLCEWGDGAAFDAQSRFEGSCAAGCPAGTICAVQVGGVAGGGGEYCAPVPHGCENNLTCACLGSCVCGPAVLPVQACGETTDADGGLGIACDNGIR